MMFMIALMSAVMLLPQVEMFVANYTRTWEVGSIVSIAFSRHERHICSPEMQEIVKEVAPMWTRYANLQFDFIDGPKGDITVGCR